MPTNTTDHLYYGYDGEVPSISLTSSSSSSSSGCAQDNCPTERSLNPGFFAFIVFLWILAVGVCVYHVRAIDAEQERRRLERRERRRARREEKKKRLDPERRKTAIQATVTTKSILYTDGKGTIQFVNDSPFEPTLQKVDKLHSKVASCCKSSYTTSSTNQCDALNDDASATSSLYDDDDTHMKCVSSSSSSPNTTTTTTSLSPLPSTPSITTSNMPLKSIRKLSDVSACSSINDEDGKKCPPPPPLTTTSLPSEIQTDKSPSCCVPMSFPSSHDLDVEDDENGVMCSICLEPFESGEEVAWSKHMKCQHIFHSDCLIQWLMKHDDCPICRKVFIEDTDLFKKEMMMNEGDGSGSNDEENDLDDDSVMDDDDDQEDDDGYVYYVVNGLVSYVRNTSYSLLSTPTTVTNDDGPPAMDITSSTIEAGLEKIDEEGKDMEFCDSPQNLEEPKESSHENRVLKGKVKRRMNRQRYNTLASDEIMEEEEEEEAAIKEDDTKLSSDSEGIV